MASFFRLIVLFTLCFAGGAHAVIPSTSEVEYGDDAYGWFSSVSAACHAHIDHLTPPPGGAYEFDSVSGLTCFWNYRFPDGSVAYGFGGGDVGQRSVQSCPANSTLGGDGCLCNVGYHESGAQTSCIPDGPPPPPDCTPPQVLINGQCQIPDPPECKVPLGAISNGNTGQYTGSNYTGGMSCFQNCISYPSFSGRNPAGQYFAHGPWTSTGAVCSGTGAGSSPTGDPADPSNPPADPDPPPVEPPPDSCKVGQCPGSVNGTAVCVPCTNTTSNTSNKSDTTNNTSNPDGTPGTPPGGSSPNGTSTNTTTNTTRCIGGKCTTTSTSTTANPDGTTTTRTDKKEETQEDFCMKNPKSPMCVEGSFGGACAGGWTCTGDAVQCATAKAVNDQACALKVDPGNSVLAVGNAALAGGDGSGHPRSSITDINVGSLNQSNPWGSSCPADRTLTTFMGEAIVVPLSSACSSFQMMGNLLVGLAMLAGAFIVVGRT